MSKRKTTKKYYRMSAKDAVCNMITINDRKRQRVYSDYLNLVPLRLREVMTAFEIRFIRELKYETQAYAYYQAIQETLMNRLCILTVKRSRNGS